MAELPSFPLGVALVGAGRVGTAVGVLLQRSGNRVVGVSSRTEASARSAAARLGSGTFDFAEDLPQADLVVIGAPEIAIPELAEAILGRVQPGTVVCHLSGSLGASVLGPIVGAGGRAAALHPVQACPDVETAVRRLPGSAWGVTCSDPETVDWAFELIRALQGEPVEVAEAARPLWHAAAVTASNGAAAVLAAGEAMLRAAGIERPERVLGPLAAGTVQNAREGGGGGRTLTGPVVRGETEALARHIAALEEVAPGLGELYRGVAAIILAAAVDSGRIDPRIERSIRQLVGP